MKLRSQLLPAIAMALFLSAPVFAQANDNPFLLKRGDNELGFWGGFSPKATTIFEGLREDEAEDRKFFIAAFRYGRTLAANDSLALQYTLDAVPIAVATGTIISRTVSIAGVTTFQRETAYGAGITPLGLQLDFANGSKVHPFVHINGGFLYFNKSMPIEDSGQFQFVGEAGGGVRIFTSERRAVNIGVRFHHISNGDRSGSNRGLNNFVIYAGFSVFK
jgi:Lipid A 3-O-deacylase (PagL)